MRKCNISLFKEEPGLGNRNISNLAIYVHYLRNRLGLTEEEFAERVDITTEDVVLLESSKNIHELSDEVVLKLCDINSKDRDCARIIEAIVKEIHKEKVGNQTGYQKQIRPTTSTIKN